VYIGSTLIWSYSAFDPDAQLFITNAAITEPVQQNAVNNLVLSLKSYGIWSKMKAIYPIVGGTAAQHKFNLKNPLDTDAAFRLVFNGGWTHSSTGALPNGTNAYADTKLNTLNNLTKTSAHIATYLRNNPTASNSYDIGNSSDSFGNFDTTLIISRYGTNTAYFQMAETFSVAGSIISTDSIGFWNNTTNGSVTKKFFKNGSLIKTADAATGAFANNALYFGACNTNNIANFFSNKQTAFGSIGDGLTDTEAANYYTAVQTFQTSLGRHVGVPIVSDSDAQAFLNAAVITDTTQASAVNTLVTNLKGYGIWTKMKALYPFVGGTANQHKFNLKNPLDTDAAFRLTFNGGITHSANGIQGNATNAYYNTFINPSTVFSPTSGGSQFVYIRNNTQSGTDLGAFQSGVNYRMTLTTNIGDVFYCAALTGGFYSRTNTSTLGFFGATREPNAPNYYAILNANSYVSANEAYQEPNSVISGLAQNNDNGSINSYSNHQHSFACIADGLTVAEAQNLRLANLAFQTTLGRNV
jgi:hypothetical protein